MNSKKGKGKSRPNKPPNPNPPQKVEDIAPAENVLEEKNVSAQKSDERVPEIISEIISSPGEKLEKEEDTPKKPKRNRGKKKKQGKDDDEDQDEHKEAVDDVKEEIVEVVTQEITIEETVSPNVRKKKNKNKKTPDPKKDPIESIPIDVIMEDKQTADIQITRSEDLKSPDPNENESKSSKKKNKKKKQRNDSDRSDKAEEISCIAAFQKLLKDDKNDESTRKISKEITTSDIIVCDDRSDVIICNIEILEETKDTSKSQGGESSGKSKKKNKKEKRDLLKEKDELQASSPTENPTMDSIGSILKDDKKQPCALKTEKEDKPTDVTKMEGDLKSKAKIAKPVERKKKTKEPDQEHEFSEDDEEEDLAKKTTSESIIESSLAMNKNEGLNVNKAKEKQDNSEIASQKFTEPLSNIQKVEPKDKRTDSLFEEPVRGTSSKKVKKSELKETISTDSESKEKVKEHLFERKEKQTHGIEVPAIKEKESKMAEIAKAIENVDISGQDVTKAREDFKTQKRDKVQDKQHFDKPQVHSDFSKIKLENIEVPLPEPMEKIEAKLDTESFREQTKDVLKSNLISVPEFTMGKKRGKSPKPQQSKQKANQDNSKEDVPVTNDPINIACVEATSELQITKQEEARSIEVEGLAEITKSDELHTPDEEINKSDSKSKKKRKKSPKPLRELGVVSKDSEFIPLNLPEKTEQKEPTNIKLDDILHESSGGEIPSDMYIVEDLEIRSLQADESEGSTCGFTPDIIQYPRATSQDLLDDNNNMSIQEITVTEEAKLQIPVYVLDTPLIQGSGATPLETPENFTIGIEVSQVDLKIKSEPEKTDIKSKMMEVNQDMEELKMSIERSLAELTAIEKSEGEKEKQFEEKITSASKEVKMNMPSEIVDKTQPLNVMKKTEEKEITPKKRDDKPDKTCGAGKKDFKDKKQKADTSTKTTDCLQSPKPISSSDMLQQTQCQEPAVFLKREDEKSTCQESDTQCEMKMTGDKKPPELILSSESIKTTDAVPDTMSPPVCPARKDNKNKNKNKKKGKQEQEPSQTVTQTDNTSTTDITTETPKDTKKESTIEPKSHGSGKKCSSLDDTLPPNNSENNTKESSKNFDPIENFDDAMTSSADDINKTFEIIADEANNVIEGSHLNPEIKIVAPIDDTKPAKREKKDQKINPVSQPKNLLGHPVIPVRSNKMDYKKEKDKTPNAVTAKVKIKDSVKVEDKKQTKDTQTDNIKKFMKNKSIDESFSSVMNENEEFVYKYSFRKVFLQSACHVCKKDLRQTRVPCNYCNLVFYCNTKHKDEDWAQHQGFCFAISTLVHMKDKKHIYANAQHVKGQEYRLLRMQMIVSCERVLKRKLSPWEQEALLYPRMCANTACREWRQSKLVDCEGCGQISYCSEKPEHFPKSHQRWCKSYSLYQKLVCHQQTKGRLEPKLPSKVMTGDYQISEKINEVLASMYEEKIDLNDIQYAALTQISTAPLTAAYCHQLYSGQANGTYKRTSSTVHVVGGELQFEADALNKWEVFFLHLRPHLQELRVVMIGHDLNPSNLPLEILGKVKLCENCRVNKRRVVFSFQDKLSYQDYRASEEFITPDIVCAFNPSIQRASLYNGNDPWPKTINYIAKQKVPFLVTSYTLSELQRDMQRVKECSEVDLKVIIEPKYNCFASVRPDRNFISDDEMPLLFKNYCFMLVCGVN